MTVAPTAVDPASARRAAPAPGERAARARAAVLAALEASDVALAAWEAGSAAFGRADEASDLDVGVLCTPGGAEDVLDEIELELRAITDALDVWRVGRSVFGMQRFWRPHQAADPAPIPLVDVSVIELEGERELWAELLTPERHGRALPLHDPHGALADAMASTRFDAGAHRERLAADLQRVRDRRPLFGPFGAKELARGRTLDAHAVHQSMVVAPLVSLLGMVHRPLRYDFGPRYLHEELPADVVECLEAVVIPRGAEALPAAIEAGLGWVDELLAGIDPAALPVTAHAEQMRAAFGAGAA